MHVLRKDKNSCKTSSAYHRQNQYESTSAGLLLLQSISNCDSAQIITKSTKKALLGFPVTGEVYHCSCCRTARTDWPQPGMTSALTPPQMTEQRKQSIEVTFLGSFSQSFCALVHYCTSISYSITPTATGSSGCQSIPNQISTRTVVKCYFPWLGEGSL